MVAKGKEGWGGMDWEYGISRCKLLLKIILFLAVWVLCCCTSSSLVEAHGLLTAAPYLVAEHGLWARSLQELLHTGSKAQAQPQ